MEVNLLDVEISRVHKFSGEGKLKAFVDIVLNGSILIKGLKVVNGPNGLFVSMPSEQSARDNKWYESVKCLNRDIREQVNAQVLAAFLNEMNEDQNA